jgi:hypothetical protein
MTSETQQESTMQAQPQAEHRWLQRLVGEWSYEGEAAEPGGETMKSSGKESVRSLGGLWVLGEGDTQMPDGSPATTILTLGYDPQKRRFVGTWVGSMMTNLWVYEGMLDGDTLTLDCEGPAFESPEKTTKYQDIIELVGDDRRVLRSRAIGEDGEWIEFMRAEYRRTA